ncbi:translation initiation factor 1A / IF-1 [Indivirus ILV1]|uniref:Translation initiation factor 1A / IF-1 n=1 Tax=Indivirus ILV1 TaxID=1977633 RepID=A0A1V0SD95_9VIRU|nr:translation initiation factor 1A / IF-1 [Indivirus ILV1]
MVKNTQGGKHHKKGKKRRNENSDGKIVYAEQNQVYAFVTKKVGGSRINVNCSDTKDRSGLIPGKFFKRVWLNEGDILLCELNPNDDSQCYILHKYSHKDASTLKSQGKITFNLNEDESDNHGYDFEDKDVVHDDRNSNILDINNVKLNNSNENDDSDNNDDGLFKNQNQTSGLKSTKWSSIQCIDDYDDKKEYTLDDL